ncbi:hypothetical protein [Methylocapsa sp. S129]|uniref:hypothetical protein n=1 Tax=Methylocapsa sp. S129 TaxID=1641869 RepID=UPI00131AF4AD|nr:hypothetical protein [Methylocapsa sp. S129]
MPCSIARLALIVGALCLVGGIEPADAFKRRPNGCDWIGGDFAEPGEVIFNTGCRGGGGRRHAAPAAQPKDEPPKLLDRLDARAPVNYGASTRKSIGAGIERFEIVGGTIAYGLDAGGLWRFTLGGKDSKQVAQSVIQFRATEAGPLFVLEKDGTLWRSDGDGSNRTFLDHEVADVQPAGDSVYVLGTDKHLSRLHADGKGRDPVDDNVSAFQAVDSTIVFVLGTDGALWRETGDMHNRVKIGQPITAFEYVADGDTTYVLTPSHFLWRQTGTGTPQQVDHDVAAFHTVDVNLVYVLATDARLWQELGDRSQAVLVDGDLAVKSGAAAFQFASKGDVEGQAVYVLDRKHGLWVETMPSARGHGK